MKANSRISARAIAAMELFSGLPPSALEEIAAAARPRRAPARTRLFDQGEGNVRAHALIAGSVRISQSGSDGAEVVIRFICPGEMFGAVALFTDGRYPADATALTETLEVSWSEPELLDLMARHPSMAIKVIRIVGGRLREVQDRVRELATQRADRRVAHAVSRLAHQCGRMTPAGTIIDLPLRRKDVADLAGTTLHTASRILAGWEKAGLIVSHRRQLTIRRLPELLRIAEDASD